MQGLGFAFIRTCKNIMSLSILATILRNRVVMLIDFACLQEGLHSPARYTEGDPHVQVLCVHSLLEHTDVTIMYDNEALYDICRRQLGS